MEWISVKDDLPEEGKCVLIIEMPEGNINIGELLNGWFVESEDLKKKKYTTHWMPLPKPPKK